MGTREWVVGFLMDEAAERVVLIRKNQPEWQAGKLNGVGGKVEPGETLPEAMRREFVEETGIVVSNWHHFARLTWEEGVVHFFRAFAPMVFLNACRTMTQEVVERHWIYTLVTPGRPSIGGRGPGSEDVIPNLRWLVPLAAHRHDTYEIIDIAEAGSTLAKPGRLDVLP